MVRWEPAARERLQKAALELFQANGFDETTVADIAAAAGLTERTFYRHFVDKREVLFGGQDVFQGGFVAAIDAAALERSATSNTAPGDTAPGNTAASDTAPDARALDIVADAVAAVCGPSGMFSEQRRPHSRLRQKVIAEHPELQERELLKMSSLSGTLAAALRERGVSEPTATLAAESGVTVFRLSFDQWIADDSTATLAEIEHDLFAALRSLSARP